MAKKFSGRYNLNDQARLNAVVKSSERTVWPKNDKPPAVDCLVIAGGGGGGGGYESYSGGGGGGGGWRQSQVTITPGITYTVLVGTGGAGVAGATVGIAGNPSQFGPIVSAGGGGGGGYASFGSYGGSTGGSGGFPGTKAYGINSPSSGSAGVFPGDQGFLGQAAFPGNRGGGGGGNYKLQDSNWFTYSLSGHAGGISYITGTEQFYAGGGGSGDTPSASGNNPGGAGGGGNGGTNPAPTGTSGKQNTGGGGGGASGGNPGALQGGNGGSGIVIIRYPDIYADPVSITGTYNTANTGSGFKVYTWTATGSITF
jgi:hypothetical protein